MRFDDRSYRKLAPRPDSDRVLGELTLSFPGLHGDTAVAPDSSSQPESFHLLYAGDHLLYAGDADITLSRDD